MKLFRSSKKNNVLLSGDESKLVNVNECNEVTNTDFTSKTEINDVETSVVPQVTTIATSKLKKWINLFVTMMLGGGTVGLLAFGFTTFLGVTIAISFLWFLLGGVIAMLFLWGIANFVILSHNDCLSVDYSLNQIEKAVHNNDTELIKKYIDSDRLIEQAYNAFGIVKERKSGTGYQFYNNHQYRIGFVNSIKRFWHKVEGRIYSPEIKNAILCSAFDKLANRDVQIFDKELRSITEEFFNLIGVDNFRYVGRKIRKGNYDDGKNTVIEFTILNTRGNINKEYVLTCNMGKSPMVVDDETNLFPGMVNHRIFAKWLSRIVIFLSDINPFTDLVFYECKILDIQRFSDFILKYQGDVEEFDISIDEQEMMMLNEQVEIKRGIVILSYKHSLFAKDEYLVQFAIELENKFDLINMLKCNISFENEDGIHCVEFKDIMFKENLPDRYSNGIAYSREIKINKDELNMEYEYIVHLLDNVYRNQEPVMGEVKRNFEKKNLVVTYTEHVKVDVLMVKWAHHDTYIKLSSLI